MYTSKNTCCTCSLESNGVVQRCVVVTVFGVNTGSIAEEVLSCLKATLAAGKVEGRAAIVVWQVEVPALDRSKKKQG